MPLYDYKCKECGHEVRDYNKKISADHPTTCPSCGKEGLEQHHFSAGQHVQYKGPDWNEASGKRGRF
jgi:putative FmdB family regulatory protein